MKKLMFAAAVMAAGAAMAVESSVVGYNTMNILKDDYTMFGIQFAGVSADGVKFKDLGITATGGTGLGDADNILVWKDGEYINYYFGDWGEEAEDPSWNNIWYNYNEGEIDASDEIIEPGTACWYLRRGDATSLTVSGAVKLTPTTVTILADDYTMFTCPYPTAIKFKNINVSNPTGGTGLGDADNMLVWKSGEYVNYYYGDWGSEAEDPSWNNIWYNYNAGEVDASEETIDPGIACWYLRRGEATTISFTSPLAQ